MFWFGVCLGKFILSFQRAVGISDGLPEDVAMGAKKERTKSIIVVDDVDDDDGPEFPDIYDLLNFEGFEAIKNQTILEDATEELQKA